MQQPAHRPSAPGPRAATLSTPPARKTWTQQVRGRDPERGSRVAAARARSPSASRTREQARGQLALQQQVEVLEREAHAEQVGAEASPCQPALRVRPVAPPRVVEAAQHRSARRPLVRSPLASVARQGHGQQQRRGQVDGEEEQRQAPERRTPPQPAARSRAPPSSTEHRVHLEQVLEPEHPARRPLARPRAARLPVLVHPASCWPGSRRARSCPSGSTTARDDLAPARGSGSASSGTGRPRSRAPTRPSANSTSTSTGSRTPPRRRTVTSDSNGPSSSSFSSSARGAARPARRAVRPVRRSPAAAARRAFFTRHRVVALVGGEPGLVEVPAPVLAGDLVHDGDEVLARWDARSGSGARTCAGCASSSRRPPGPRASAG